MLYPQSNKFRSTTNLNGIWNYKLVEDDYIPLNKAEKTFPMAVPASINDIVTDKRIAEYVGKVLFETEFSLPQEKRARALGALFTKPIFYIIAEKFPILPQSLLRTTALLP